MPTISTSTKGRFCVNSYTGFLVEQRPGAGVQFLVFVASAKDIVTWAKADNIKLDRGNVQRALVDSRWRQIAKFFNANNNNVIPTSVTIALDETVRRVDADDVLPEKSYSLKEVGKGLTRITFSADIKESAFIIDGQHRLKGMSVLDYDVMVPVSLFLDLPTIERAFQFVTINNKSHKVPTSNLKALLANFEEIEVGLRNRLTQASITVPQFATAVDVLNEDPESPFYRMVDWVNNRFVDAAPIVPPTALENSLKAITRAFPETKADEAEALAVLYRMWTAIFAEYGITAANAAEYPNLVMKATIQRISEMVVDKLASDYDPAFSAGPMLDDSGAKTGLVAAALVHGIPAEFWTQPWALKSLDTSAGRELIEDDIRMAKRLLMRNGGNPPPEWRSSLRLFGRGDDDEA